MNDIGQNRANAQDGAFAKSDAPLLQGEKWQGACDCHIHINDPKFAYAQHADLQPPPATVAEYKRVQSQLGTQRVVVVQPSSYGTDNRCTLEAVAQLGATHARAIVVIDTATPAEDLVQMHEQGARGVRFNLLRNSPVAAAQMRQIAQRIAPLGWHIQLHASAAQIVSLEADLRAMPVPIVFDHLARLPNNGGVAHPAFSIVRTLLAENRAWVKLSGLELDEPQANSTYQAAAEVARQLIKIAPDRLVWGSNWPHPATHQTLNALPNDRALLQWLFSCTTDPILQRKILLTNACSLYGFSTISQTPT